MRSKKRERREKRATAPVPLDAAAPVASSTGRKQSAPKWIFNTRLFLWTLGVIVLVVPTAMGWHAVQIRLQTGAILKQVDRDIEQQKWRSARNGLEHYLTLMPRDMEARVRLAEVVDKTSQGQHVVDMFALAVGQFPERWDLRIRYAELLLELEYYPQAILEAEHVLDLQPNEPRSLKVRALALANGPRVVTELDLQKKIMEDAIKASPDDVDLVRQLAQAMREIAASRTGTSAEQEKRAQWGDKWLGDLVERLPQNVDAWLARYDYRRQFRLDGEDDDLDRAAALEPESPRVLLALGQRAMRRGNLGEAENSFHLLVEKAPQQPEGYLFLSEALRRQERFAEALQLVESGLRYVGRSDLSLRMERVVLQVLSNQLEGVEAELQAIERDVIQLTSQLEGSRQRRSLGEATAILRAIYQLAGNAYEDARTTLRQAFPENQVSSPHTPEGRRRGEALELIGQSHANLEEWELAGNALEEAARLLPERIDFAGRAAKAYERAGNWRRASRVYDGLRTANAAPPGIHTAYASAGLEEQRRLPPARQNWQPFSEGIESARSAGERPARLAVLEAESQFIQGRPDEAWRSLRRAENFLVSFQLDLAESQTDLTRVAELYEELDKPEDAARVRELFPSELQKQLASAGRLIRQGKLEQAIEGLTEWKEKSPELSVNEWAPALIRLQLLANHPEEALRLNTLLRDSNSDQRDWLYERAEIARRAGNADEFARVSDEWKSLEGERGSWSREIRLRYLLAQPDPLPNDVREEAERLLDDLEGERPDWPVRLALSGQFAARTGNRAQAIEDFRRAVQLGGGEAFAKALTHLLLQDRQLADAGEYLSLVNQIRSTSNWLTMRLPEFLAVHRAEWALVLNPESSDVSHDDVSQEIATKLARGRVLLIQDEREAAAELFQSLLENDEHNLDAWTGLLASAWQQRKFDELRRHLARLVELETPTARDRHFLVAQGYLLLDDVESAHNHYRQALADQESTDPERSSQMAQSYVRFLDRLDPPQAEEALREWVMSAPEDAFARRRLFSMLMAQRGEDRWEEARELLDELGEALAGVPDATAELARMRAVLVLTQSSDESVREAIEILQRDVMNSSDVPVDDHLFLAELFGRLGDVEQEEKQLNEALERQPGNAFAIRRFFDLALGRQQYEQASSWLQRLEEVAPEKLSTDQRRARWLFADGQVDEARMVLESAFEWSSSAAMSDENRASFLVNFGELFESVEAFEEAARAYQQAYDVEPKMLPALLGYLVRTGRGDEAFEKWQRSVGTAGTPDAGAVELLCRVLSYTQITTTTVREVDSIIRDALQRNANDANLLFSAATYYQIQEDAEFALELFTRLDKGFPDNPRILNNFAYLLSEQPGRLEEAEKMIERAMEVEGVSPQLLDTRGMIRFRQDRWEEARQDFEWGLSLSPSPRPVTRFHLALAQDRMGDVAAARESLRMADSEGLPKAVLSKADRELRDGLTRELGL